MKTVSSDYGDATVQTYSDPDGRVIDVRLVDVAPRVAVSRELLDNHDPRWMRVDGDRLVACGFFFLDTGEVTPGGDPIFRRIDNEGDLAESPRSRR